MINIFVTELLHEWAKCSFLYVIVVYFKWTSKFSSACLIGISLEKTNFVQKTVILLAEQFLISFRRWSARRGQSRQFEHHWLGIFWDETDSAHNYEYLSVNTHTKSLSKRSLKTSNKIQVIIFVSVLMWLWSTYLMS